MWYASLFATKAGSEALLRRYEAARTGKDGNNDGGDEKDRGAEQSKQMPTSTADAQRREPSHRLGSIQLDC
jgi:hypothetical protein